VRSSTYRAPRTPLHVRVRLGGVDIEIITAQFKSKLLMFPGGRFSRTMKRSVGGSPPTRSTGAAPKPPPCAPPPLIGLAEPT
jgi:hypothetical protein